MRDCTALVSLSLGLHILAGFLIVAAFVGVLVWLESRRPDTDQEIAHELEALEDAWKGIEDARRNNPPLSEMEVRP